MFMVFQNRCRLLNIQLPLVDPSLYIQRFAAQLDFGGKTLAVANTALRIVQRMGRDWIHTGRRPSGISGASLLIAARLHGFATTPQDIVQVVRVCDSTLRQRLSEFADTTAAASVTVGELLAGDRDAAATQKMESAEGAADPPAFTRAVLRDAREKALVALWLRAQNGEDRGALLREERARRRALRGRGCDPALVADYATPVSTATTAPVAAAQGIKAEMGDRAVKESSSQKERESRGKTKGDESQRKKGKAKDKKKKKKGSGRKRAGKAGARSEEEEALREVLGDSLSDGDGGDDSSSDSDNSSDSDSSSEGEDEDEVEKEIWDTLQNSEFLAIEHTARRVLDQNARAFAQTSVNPLKNEPTDDSGAGAAAGTGAAPSTTTNNSNSNTNTTPTGVHIKQSMSQEQEQEQEGSSAPGEEVVIGRVAGGEDEEEGDTLEDIPDEDVDCYIQTPEQVELKRRAWEELYSDYIAEQEQKEAAQREREKTGGTRRTRHSSSRGGHGAGDGTVADATRQALQNRTSTRVNYAALGRLLTLDHDALARGPLPYEEVRAAKRRAGGEGDDGAVPGVVRPREGGALSLAQKIARNGDDDDEDDEDGSDEDDGDDIAARFRRKRPADDDGSDDEGYFDEF